MANRGLLIIFLIIIPIITFILSIIHGAEEIVEFIVYLYVVGFGILILYNIRKSRYRK
jgi:hypothetical protein